MPMPPEPDGNAARSGFDCRASRAGSLWFCFYLMPFNGPVWINLDPLRRRAARYLAQEHCGKNARGRLSRPAHDTA